jgi:hypothetical protein
MGVLIGGTPSTPVSDGVAIAIASAFVLILTGYCWGRRGVRALGRRKGKATLVLDRYVPELVGAPSFDQQQPRFTLTPIDRSIFGVREHDDGVVFGASGGQWAGAVFWLGCSLIGALVAVLLSADPRLVGLLVAAVVCAGLSTALLLRVRVRLEPVGLALQGRSGGERVLRWTEVEEIAIEVHESGVRWGAPEAATLAQGVVRVADNRWIALPGFRSRIWSANKLRDPLNPVAAKIGIVLRYRQSAATSNA